MNFSTSNLITVLFIAIIVGAFIFFLRQALKMNGARKTIEHCMKTSDILAELQKTKLKGIVEKYRSTINLCDNKRTSMPSFEFFSTQQIAKYCKFNLHLLDSAAGTLVGLGLIGTFAGHQRFSYLQKQYRLL